MTTKTWTRKGNAEKAVQKALQAEVDDGIFITALQAENIGTAHEPAWAVKVEIENTAAEAAALQEKIGNVAEINGTLPEPAPEPEEKAEEKAADLGKMDLYGAGTEEAPVCPHCGIDHIGNGYSIHEKEHPNEERKFICLGCGGEWGPKIGRRSFKGRQSTLSGRKFKVVGGSKAKNPYRPGTRSHRAFEILQTNPGISYEDFKEMGGRVRTLQDEVKAFRVKDA